MTKCNCPRCSSIGRSVGAMNYEETQLWDTSGSYRESGLISSKNGSYSEHGTSQSKRAATFEEPQPYSINSSSHIVTGAIVIFALFMLPTMLSMVSSIAGVDSANNKLPSFDFITNFISNYWGLISLPIVFCIIFSIKNRSDNDEILQTKLNTEVWPKQLARYNELYYCYNCHSLYDNKNNVEDANSIGFNKMMNI